MKLERLTEITDPVDQRRIWEFCYGIFRPVNESSPINQFYNQKSFLGFMNNPRVIKFVIFDKEEIIGVGLITDQLDLEPLISTEYFETHHPGVPIYYIISIAIKSDRRGQVSTVRLLRAMISEVPDNGLGLFFHSKGINTLLPKFAEKVGLGHIDGGEVDTEALCVYRWKGGTKVDL